MAQDDGVRQASWGIAPYIIVDDVVATASFYRDRLGFAYERLWGEPPRFCMVKRGAKGVKVAREICDQPYGCRDFDVEDCNGYRLCFGHAFEG